MSNIEFGGFSRELRLVISCSRWPLGANASQEIQTLATGSIDWNRFLAWVGRNGVAPLVFRNLRQVACPSVTEDVIGQLQSQATACAHRTLMQISEGIRVTRLLSDAGIRSMIIKGPVLSVLAFGNPALRDSKDLDLLIDPDRVLEADQLISQAGYRRVAPTTRFTPAQSEIYRRRRGQDAYYLEGRNVSLELHWRLTTNSLLMPLDSRISWSRSEPIRVAGATFATLPDEDLFLYLCVHGSMHMWFRLKWLADIAALLHRVRPELVPRVAMRAQALGVDRSFHQAMILADGLMGASVPTEVLARARQDRAAMRLAAVGCRALNWRGSPEEPMETRWFSSWVNWHAYGLRPGLRFRLKELQNQMFSPEDISRIGLPDQLFFLYLPLRPLSWVTRHLNRLVSR